MPRKSTYHITPHRSGGWQVKSEGAERASAVLPTKADALGRGREIARNMDGSLKVHGLDGRFQTEYTYGKDPYPPRG
jgi:hypothetical protein